MRTDRFFWTFLFTCLILSVLPVAAIASKGFPPFPFPGTPAPEKPTPPNSPQIGVPTRRLEILPLNPSWLPEPREPAEFTLTLTNPPETGDVIVWLTKVSSWRGTCTNSPLTNDEKEDYGPDLILQVEDNPGWNIVQTDEGPGLKRTIEGSPSSISLSVKVSCWDYAARGILNATMTPSTGNTSYTDSERIPRDDN